MAGFSTETTRSLFNALNAGRIALFVSPDRLDLLIAENVSLEIAAQLITRKAEINVFKQAHFRFKLGLKACKEDIRFKKMIWSSKFKEICNYKLIGLKPCRFGL